MIQSLDVAVKQFGLDGKNSDALASAGSKVIPWLDEVLDYFYDYAQEEAARFFHSQEMLEHARDQQKKHWTKLLSVSFDDDYAAATKTIGEVHFRIELPFDLYLSGYSRATSYIQTLLLKRSSRIIGPVGKAKMARQLSALTRAFTLDMNLVIEAYFNAQQEEQVRAFKYLQDGMGRMGRKDLSEDIPSPEHSDFPARYEAMRLGFNALQCDMGDVMRSIKIATEDLDLTAAEVNSGADDLAHRTEAQAATLEQTTMSVEEITKSVLSSSKATQETDAMMAQTHQKAKNWSKCDAGNRGKKCARLRTRLRRFHKLQV